jgi:hypothetical protein
MAKADFDYVPFPEVPDIVFIRDLNLGKVSVTNDAEAVVREVSFAHPDKRIVYQDSDGFWDELIHYEGYFIKFGEYDGPHPF